MIYLLRMIYYNIKAWKYLYSTIEKPLNMHSYEANAYEAISAAEKRKTQVRQFWEPIHGHMVILHLPSIERVLFLRFRVRSSIPLHRMLALKTAWESAKNFFIVSLFSHVQTLNKIQSWISIEHTVASLRSELDLEFQYDRAHVERDI